MTLAVPVDHLVYATLDLDRGIEHIGDLLGVRPIAGGPHLGRGTHNALVALDTDDENLVASDASTRTNIRRATFSSPTKTLYGFATVGILFVRARIKLTYASS